MICTQVSVLLIKEMNNNKHEIKYRLKIIHTKRFIERTFDWVEVKIILEMSTLKLRVLLISLSLSHGFSIEVNIISES